jgi:hypothetical protein
VPTSTDPSAHAVSRPATDRVWRELGKASFAVVSHVTPAGEPRSSGVVYAIADRRMYVVVAADSWKARHIATGGTVAVTVPVRRGGLLSLVAPIPPATISFHATATVHPAGSPGPRALPARLESILPPPDRRGTCSVIEIRPAGDFLTYGIGIPLMRMRTPALARGRAPVG